MVEAGEEKKEKTMAEEKKPSSAEEKKQGEEPKVDTPPPPPPPPPQEIVLKVYMHCEGCAKKVKRSLKGFPGVEDVITDYRSHKVVVKGEKADPVKVMARIQRKSHRKVELISPLPVEKDEKPKAAEQVKKEEVVVEAPQVITAVLKVHMHCEACSLAIKKRILRIKGVESVETDLKSSQVTVVGMLDPAKLVEFILKRTGKQAVIIKQEPKKEEEIKVKEEEKKEEKKGPENEAEKKTGGGDESEKIKSNVKDEGDDNEKTKLIEVKHDEFFYYPALYAPKWTVDPDLYTAVAPPPQLFSDENPNACSVM